MCIYETTYQQTFPVELLRLAIESTSIEYFFLIYWYTWNANVQFVKYTGSLLIETFNWFLCKMTCG